MNKQTVEKRLSALKTKAEKLGAHFEHNLYDAKHLDCFWYDGNDLITIEYRGYVICFDVCGDVCISVVVSRKIDPDGYIVIRHKGGGEPLYFNDEARTVVKNDSGLRRYITKNRINWENNNWINVIIVDQQTSETVSEPFVSNYSSLLDAAEMDCDCCIDYIDKLILEMSGGRTS